MTTFLPIDQLGLPTGPQAEAVNVKAIALQSTDKTRILCLHAYRSCALGLDDQSWLLGDPTATIRVDFFSPQLAQFVNEADILRLTGWYSL